MSSDMAGMISDMVADDRFQEVIQRKEVNVLAAGIYLSALEAAMSCLSTGVISVSCLVDGAQPTPDDLRRLKELEAITSQRGDQLNEIMAKLAEALHVQFIVPGVRSSADHCIVSGHSVSQVVATMLNSIAIIVENQFTTKEPFLALLSQFAQQMHEQSQDTQMSGSMTYERNEA